MTLIATLTLDHALPDGAYEITAFYYPNQVYRDLVADPIPYLAGEGQGYVVTLDSTCMAVPCSHP